MASGVRSKFQRTVIYGPGGIGKSSLAVAMKGVGIRPLVLDVGNSTRFLDVDRIGEDEGLRTWDDLRAVLLPDQPHWQGVGAVFLDDLTRCEELARDWVLANVKHEKGHEVKNIEGYGFGKGYTHVYETFLRLLGDLDAHVRAGRQVVCVAHECTANVPNPGGEDWIRYEPRLQVQKSGANSIRARVKEWADHLLFIGYDVAVSNDGKATGGGTRSIYPAELPTHMAKSRTLADRIDYELGSAELWKQLFGEPK